MRSHGVRDPDGERDDRRCARDFEASWHRGHNPGRQATKGRRAASAATATPRSTADEHPISLYKSCIMPDAATPEPPSPTGLAWVILSRVTALVAIVASTALYM